MNMTCNVQNLNWLPSRESTAKELCGDFGAAPSKKEKRKQQLTKHTNLFV